MNKNTQRLQIIIATVLLLIVGIVNYYNYYAPPKPIAEIFSFASMSDSDQKSMIDAAKKNGGISKNANKKSHAHKTKSNTQSQTQTQTRTNIPKVDVSGESLDNNYINYAVDSNGKLGRWESNKITVFVSESEYQNTIYKALSHYNDVFAGYFKFYLTSNRNQADIKIDMVSHFSSNTHNEQGYIAGLTDNSFAGEERFLKKSWVQLLNTEPNSNKKITQAKVYSVALHELGHALGIVGHSPNPSDIMYAATKANEFSARDIATLKIMYSGDKELIAQKTRYFAQTKLREAEEYAKKLPNQAISWINLGKVYYDLDRKEDALEAYKKALAIEPNNAMIYRSMAECYYQSGKYEAAIKYSSIANDHISAEDKKVSGYQMIGLCYSKLKDFEKSYDYLKRAYDIDRTNFDNFKNYLIACTQVDKKREVLSAIQAYKTINPNVLNDATVKNIYNWAK